MAKTFRDWEIEQLMMFPPSVEDFVPPGHVAHFVRSTVLEALDLSAILDCYSEERGSPPYHPVMMTALILYANCQGIYSSRRIAKACQERVDFMAVTGMQRPDFRTISDFRKRHLAALMGLFVQVLRLCQKAGLVKLGHVALDGTKIKANASKHKAMSYKRMKKADAELAAIVSGWFKQAQAADAREDQEYGAERSNEELPDWVRDKERRLKTIREARARLEAEAQAAEKGEEKKTGGPGRPRNNEPGTPKDSAQSNFTDRESRIMKSHDGFIQGYNVDEQCLGPAATFTDGSPDQTEHQKTGAGTVG
jgi:transposase